MAATVGFPGEDAVTVSAFVLPVPTKATLAVPLTALLVIARFAVSAPTCCGVTLTLMVQVVPGPTVVQLLVCAKLAASVPVMEKPKVVRFVTPVFPTVTVNAALVDL